MTYTTLVADTPAPGVTRLRMSRPNEMNTLSLEFLDEFNRAIDAAVAARTRVLVVREATSKNPNG